MAGRKGDITVMTFSNLRAALAGATIVIAASSAAYAQDDMKAAFDARYAELSGAMLGKDATKVGAILAPEYTATDIRGETHNRADALARLDKMPPEMAKMKPETKVLSVKQNGDSAAVESQMTLHMTRPGDDGKDMVLDIEITADDTWVQRGGAWQLSKSVQKAMQVSKDGEVVFKQAN